MRNGPFTDLGAGPITASSAAVGREWTPAPDGQRPPPASYKTGAKNIYDQKIPKAKGFAIAKASQTIPFFPSEITMPKVNLSGMTVEELIDLRERVEGLLS